MNRSKIIGLVVGGLLLLAGTFAAYMFVKKGEVKSELIGTLDAVSSEAAFKESESLRMKLMTELYGSYNAKEQTSYWLADKNKPGKSLAEFTAQDTLITVAAMDTVYELKGKSYYMLVTSTNKKDFTCRSCLPFIGVFVYGGDPAQPTPLLKQYVMTEAGAWGMAPEYLIERIGKDQIGLIEKYLGGNQGNTIETYTIYAMGNGVFEPAISVTTLDTNSDTDETLDSLKYETKAATKFEETGGEYYNLVVRTNGTKRNGDWTKIEQVNKTETYVFRNGEYVLE